MFFSCPVVVGGDLNIHVENPVDDGARRLHELLTSFDMIQNVNMPTHRCNGTLDLVITFADYKLDEVTVDPPGIRRPLAGSMSLASRSRLVAGC